MSLHPDYHVIEGYLQLTAAWSLELEQPLNRRIEDGSMVLWRPGFTIWLNVWGNDNDETIDDRAGRIKSDVSSEAHDIVSGTSGGLFRHSYRLEEMSGNKFVYGYFGFIIAPEGHVQIAIYFDAMADLAAAKAIVAGITYDDD